MKNVKWIPLKLEDVRKGMLVIYSKYGFTPSEKSREPRKINNVVFDTNGHISIELGDYITIRIVDLVRDANGQKMQLYYQVPLTIKEKYERLTEAADKCIRDIRLNEADCFVELAELMEEYKE